jgi:LmbE family N-acetylglucosaminyl deacetylase
MQRIITLLLLAASLPLFAKKPHQPSSAEIYRDMQKLNVLGSVLYLAAHPDDENTRFISWSANHMMYETSYLSLTRGDGGQNLIGPEIREELGIIRTQELLAARRIDGGQQFFTRAVDFGYSKTSEETQRIWDRDEVLFDMVYVIRLVQPDVIVCRFPVSDYSGHGHHIASAELGLEAFEIAAQEDVSEIGFMPSYLEPWQTKRIVVNTGRWWNPDISADEPGMVAHDIGAYDALLGMSNNERSMLSRSQHKSQGFGATGTRGEYIEYFEHMKGEEASESLFEGIDDSWMRLTEEGFDAEYLAGIEADINSMLENYDMEKPWESIDELLALRKKLTDAGVYDGWIYTKQMDVEKLIADCAGLYLEAKAPDYAAVAEQSIPIELEMINRSPVDMEVTGVWVWNTEEWLEFDTLLPENQVIQYTESIWIPPYPSVSQPYWLVNEHSLGLYNVDNYVFTGEAENAPAIEISFDIEFADGQIITFTKPLIYKWNDPVKGEQYRPFVKAPPVTVNFDNPIYIYPDESSRTVQLTVKCMSSEFAGLLELSAPEGWKLSPGAIEVTFENKYEEQYFEIEVTPSKNAINGMLEAFVRSLDDSVYRYSISTIEYDHIPTQVWFPPSESKLVHFDLKTAGEKLGYIEGAGDNIPEAMRLIGYQVDVLDEEDLSPENLEQYDAIILGIRALNTEERIEYMLPNLWSYAETGGTLIYQYNTSHRLKTEDFAPLPITLSRDRVTEEHAEVKFLKPKHPVLNSPNKITHEDFENWVQERGLYFPSEWDDQYEAILSWHDTGEPARDGSLLVAKLGEGHIVYSGISFFRELPAGVPGAFRLFANLIALGNE